VPLDILAPRAGHERINVVVDPACEWGLMEEAAGLDGFQGYKDSTRVLATLVFVKCGTPRSALRQSVVVSYLGQRLHSQVLFF